MYPIKLGFDEAIKRIERLQKNKHYAEALVTAVFTFEKTMRRGLKISILARGFSMRQAEKMTERKAFGELKEMWPLFDRSHSGLSDFIGNKEWQHVPNAIEMRNKLVHGARVYKLEKCYEVAERVLNVLKKLRSKVNSEYGRDPWEKITGRRIPRLQWLV